MAVKPRNASVAPRLLATKYAEKRIGSCGKGNDDKRCDRNNAGILGRARRDQSTSRRYRKKRDDDDEQHARQ